MKKRRGKQIVSVLLSVMMVLSVFGGMTFTASATTYAVGDIIEFGSYPQTKVTDSDLITALNAQAADWQSYGYYSGTGSYTDGQMTPSDYMLYCDVTYSGQKYRGVQFSQYRPYGTGYASSASRTYQDENGYSPDTSYWFLYEPLQWRVLDPTTGLVLCETIIDSQPFHNYFLQSGKDEYNLSADWGDAEQTYFANNYAECSLRQWLNADFANTAFTAAQQSRILPTTLDNSAYDSTKPAYGCAATTDSVFILSYSDVQNASYGFAVSTNNSSTREAQGSDYAKCQGLVVNSSNECSYWRLRSAGHHSGCACTVRYDGNVGGTNMTQNTHYGIRPALSLELRETPTANAPTGLTATYGQSLVNIAIPNPSGNTSGTWSWVDPTTLVGGAGVHTFPATFTPTDTTTYCPVQADLSVTVQIQNIRLVTNGQADYIAGAQASNVWFGNYKQSSDGAGGYNVDPIKWRVLSNADGKLFLLADQNLELFTYNNTYTTVTWETCDMRSWLNGYGAAANVGGNDYTADSFKGNAFTAAEYAAVAESELENANNPKYGTAGGNATTDKVFLLSIAEAMNTDYGFTDNNSNTDTRRMTNTAYVAGGGKDSINTSNDEGGVGQAVYWWLRSPGLYDTVASMVAFTGFLYYDGTYVSNIGVAAARPALKVDLKSVLFTSAAEGGKTGAGLTAVGDHADSDWKLTLLDSSRSGFTASCIEEDNGVRTIQYSGATTGTNEKISAMIVDADGIVTYYGVLCDAAAGTNTLTLDVSGKLNDGDTLYVFNEQVNGDKKTDYSSALVDVTMTAIPNDQQSVSIDDQIALNVLLDLDFRGKTADDVTITLGGEPYACTGTKMTGGDYDGLYKFKVVMAPSQIADEILVTIGSGASIETIPTSVKAYCTELQKPQYTADYAKAQALAKAMLVYGQTAKVLFGYDGEQITDLSETETAKELSDAKTAAQNAAAVFSDGTGKVTGASFMALTKPEFRFYTSSITEAQAVAYNQAGITATMDAAKADTLTARFVKKADNSVLLEVTGVSAENMDKTITVTVTDLGTITFNGNAFARAMAKSSNATQQNLGAALYNYGAAAKTCFGA